MKNAGKACNNRLYRHIRTFEKIIKNYFVILIKFEYHFLLCYYNKVCSNIIQIRKTDYMEIIYYYETEKC